MSEQTGLVKFKGRLGDISFFTRNGVHRASFAKGISKERYLNDPKFKRTRENVAEFGGLSQSVKSFRAAIKKVANFRDNTLGGRLTKLFRTMMKRADGIRGQRPVLISQNRSLLQGLELSRTADLFPVFAAPFTSSSSARNAVNTNVTGDLRDMITAPPTATHFRLVQMLGTIADTIFDDASKKFVPSNEQNGLCEATFTDYTPLISTAAVNIDLQTSLPGAIADDVTVLHGLGIIFYEKVGSEYYALQENSAMKIVGVF